MAISKNTTNGSTGVILSKSARFITAMKLKHVVGSFIFVPTRLLTALKGIKVVSVFQGKIQYSSGAHSVSVHIYMGVHSVAAYLLLDKLCVN